MATKINVHDSCDITVNDSLAKHKRLQYCWNWQWRNKRVNSGEKDRLFVKKKNFTIQCHKSSRHFAQRFFIFLLIISEMGNTHWGLNPEYMEDEWAIRCPISWVIFIATTYISTLCGYGAIFYGQRLSSFFQIIIEAKFP